MNVRRRALLGAASGALLVLLVHPSTRPGLLAAFLPSTNGQLARLLERPTLTRPRNKESGAAYLHAGADRLVAGSALKEDERATMVRLTQEGDRTDADNAFWSLARFVFRGGEGALARADWRAASKRRQYNDYQNSALLADRDRIAEHIGDAQAWIYAAIAPQRSDALARLIRDLGLRAYRRIPAGPQRTDFAFETIQNGARLRDGSRRLYLGFMGIDLIEGATYGPTMSEDAFVNSPRRMWIAKGRLTEDLRRHRTASEAAACDREFRINDSWQVFSSVESPDDRRHVLGIAAVLVGTVPGGLLLAGMFGGVVWLFGKRAGFIAKARSQFRGPGLTACSLALLAVGAAIGYPWIGLAAGACALLPAIGPERPRRYDGSPLGPLHAFVVGCVVLSLLIGIALTAVSRSLAGSILGAQGPIGAWLGDAGRLSAAVVAVLGASALVAPAWAVVRRFPTPGVAARTYCGIGKGLAFAGLGTAILASPICFALDRWLGDDLAKIALNEQVYYNPSVVGDR